MARKITSKTIEDLTKGYLSTRGLLKEIQDKPYDTPLRRKIAESVCRMEGRPVDLDLYLGMGDDLPVYGAETLVANQEARLKNDLKYTDILGAYKDPAQIRGVLESLPELEDDGSKIAKAHRDYIAVYDALEARTPLMYKDPSAYIALSRKGLVPNGALDMVAKSGVEGARRVSQLDLAQARLNLYNEIEKVRPAPKKK